MYSLVDAIVASLGIFLVVCVAGIFAAKWLIKKVDPQGIIPPQSER